VSASPVVYEHFGGKEASTPSVVDREMRQTAATPSPERLTRRAPRILLSSRRWPSHVHRNADRRFPDLVRDSPVTSATGNFSPA